jgi:Resolvase, N terminal domain
MQNSTWQFWLNRSNHHLLTLTCITPPPTPNLSPGTAGWSLLIFILRYATLEHRSTADLSLVFTGCAARRSKRATLSVRPTSISGNRQCSRCAHAWKDSDASMICGNGRRHLASSACGFVDEDLGRSGTGSVERPGFGRLLAAACSGKVGAVLAFEASRLARNNRDWHHSIDLCAMASTLVIDHDGIYDPSFLNDRLLLGLKRLDS